MSLPPGSTGPRPRPILIAQSVLAGLGVITGAAGLADQLPAAAAWWIVLGVAAVNVGLGFYLQAVSTPLSAPQDGRGVPMVPVDTVPAPPASLVPMTGPQGAVASAPITESGQALGVKWTGPDRPDA